jgi:hypothetical protein
MVSLNSPFMPLVILEETVYRFSKMIESVLIHPQDYHHEEKILILAYKQKILYRPPINLKRVLEVGLEVLLSGSPVGKEVDR